MKTMNRYACWGALALLALGAQLYIGCAQCARNSAPGGEPAASLSLATAERIRSDGAVQAVWVARMHYRYENDVAAIMRNCAAMGVDTVFWQVRGEGCVAYPSALEPWAREFDYRDPGFDPLATAVREAHRHGLRIEAWVNVMPGWKGRQAPTAPSQLHRQHPEWFLHDANGKPQPLSDNYVILNPCLPEVREHIVGLCREIVANYDVDGLHLDYVRYAWDGDPKASQRYPRDSKTLSLYESETGKTPDADATAWDRWRADQLTRLVREIRYAVRDSRPGATLTVAVVRNPDNAYKQYLQDGADWLRSGLVDAIMPMAYTTDVSTFAADIGAYRRLAPQGRIVPGVGLYKHTRRDTLDAQLNLCRAWGGDVALFSYDSLHPTHQDRTKQPTAADVQQARVLRQRAWADYAARAGAVTADYN